MGLSGPLEQQRLPADAGVAVTDNRVTIPIIALGAAGAFAVATLLRPRRAGATVPGPPAPASAAPSAMSSSPATPTASAPAPLFDFGRPLPDDVRAVVSSGWLESRGDRLHRGLDIGAPTGTPIL